MTNASMPTQRPGRQPLHSLRERARDQSWRAAEWLRRCLERENLIAGLKTFSWLAPLTLLIWIYAEREQVDRLENQTIPIEVRSNDPNLFVQLQMGENKDDKNVVA